MISRVLAIANLEFQRLRRSWIFWLGMGLVVGVPLLIDSPLSDGHLWIESSAAFAFSHGVSMLGGMFIPLLVASLYYIDQTTRIALVVYSQPIRGRDYALGKFIGGFITYLTLVGVGIVLYILTPIYFGAWPYSPLYFLKAVAIYTLPSMFFFTALCYLLTVIFDRPLLTIIVPIFFLTMSEMVPKQLDFLIRGKELATLATGGPVPEALVWHLMINRGLILGIGVILLTSAIFIFSPRKYLESR